MGAHAAAPVGVPPRTAAEVGCSYWRAPLPRPPARRSRAAPPPPRRLAARAAAGDAAAAAGGETAAAAAKPATLKEEARRSNAEVFDRLADAFVDREPGEWRKLIAFSRQWPSLADGVIARLEARGAAAGGDAEAAAAARRAARRLRIVSDELAAYARTLEAFRAAPSREWEAMVAGGRAALSRDFFGYLELRVRAAASNAAAAERKAAAAGEAGADEEAAAGKDGSHGATWAREASALAALAAQLAALAEAADRVAADGDALDAAAGAFESLLASGSLPEAERKIDELAAAGRLDPALLLTMAKAYAGAKETDKTREEVKDLMAHLYFKAKESFAAQAPPEARILKFLLSVDSPAERAALLSQALTPGAPLGTGAEDFLHTTPAALLNVVDNVLSVYDAGGAAGDVGGGMGGGVGGAPGTMAGQAAALMNPEVISRLRELRALLRRDYG
jgi:hypothetical protein